MFSYKAVNPFDLKLFGSFCKKLVAVICIGTLVLLQVCSVHNFLVDFAGNLSLQVQALIPLISAIQVMISYK